MYTSYGEITIESKIKPKVQIKFHFCREVKLSLNQEREKRDPVMQCFHQWPLAGISPQRAASKVTRQRPSSGRNPSDTIRNSLRSKLGC